MSTVKQGWGTKTALTCSGLSTLAASNFAVSAAYDCTTNGPLDVIIEGQFECTSPSATPSFVAIYCKASWDGTLWQSGPETGTTTTDIGNLTWLGNIQINSSGVNEIGPVSVASGFPGNVLPPHFKIIPYNQTGVALTSGVLSTIEIPVTVN